MGETQSTMTNTVDEDAASTCEAEEVACFYYNSAGQKAPNNVTKVIVGPDVICFYERAFRGYERLKEVDMSKAMSLETIDTQAFANCSALDLVKWAPNLKTIGRAAFWKCTSLTEADLSNLHALETIAGRAAFAFCSALDLVKWAPNIKTIGKGAFCECTSLTEADFSNLHALETIEDCAFARCSALHLVKWAPNIKTIGKGAFGQCTSLTEADFSNLHALETIGKWAFASCSTLDRVKWAPNVKTIGDEAFLACSVQDVMIPLRHLWLVRKLPFDETKLRSVDMQGHDLKKAIRIKNLYPQATPRLTINRLVSMYAKSPLTAVQLEDAAQIDDGVMVEDWAEARIGDLQGLEGIRKAYADSIFKLLHWYAGNGLAENLFANRKKRKRDTR